MLRVTSLVVGLVCAARGVPPLVAAVIGFLHGKGVVVCLLSGLLPAAGYWCAGLFVIALGEATGEVLDRLRQLTSSRSHP